jgi:hypothetical protein
MTAFVLIQIVALANSPAAPVGQQVPPARPAASAMRARRGARGSLLLTTGTASLRRRLSPEPFRRA